MSLKRTVLLGAVAVLAFVGGVARGQTERFELEGNLKFFGTGNGVIFPDGTKVTSAAFAGVTLYTRTLAVPSAGVVKVFMGMASCDAGDVVVGGGVKFTQAGVLTQVIYSIVNEPNGSGNAWLGQIDANPMSAGFVAGSTLVVTARCADVTP